MSGFATCRSRPIHTRNISIATFPAEDHAIVVEGRLKDERLIEIFSITSEQKIPPGVVHEIVLRLLVRGPHLTIEDLEVEFVHMPRESCRDMVDCLRPLLGRRISSGFTSYVKKAFGGPRGCAHLNSLLLAMAPAAVQGFWNHSATRKMSPADAFRVMDNRLLIDSCGVWRSGGPLAEELLKVLAGGGPLSGTETSEGKDGKEGQ